MNLFLKIVCCLLVIITILADGTYAHRVGLTEKKEKTAFLSDLESEVVSEVNLARTQPKKYAEFLTAYSKHFAGNELHETGQINLLTREGVQAVNEAIRFLKSQKPVSIVTPSRGMSKGADDMVRMQETTTQTGHKGRDGSTFSERINRYGTWNGSCSENIDYGNNSARRIVMALIIDDGVPGRGHRKSIFESRFKRIGVASGGHRTYNYMCVIELAANYTEK